MGFVTPTPVQAESIPAALEGKDILGSAQTGTGKTASFGIPLLAKLHPNPGMKGLILAPTRELAAQIHKVLREMGNGMSLTGALVVGGESFARQKREIKGGADYYVCTPGRLIDHLDAGLKLDSVHMLILDEVDRMLDMGFAPQLKMIVPRIPKERQTLFFSATLPKEIMAIAQTYLRDPVRVSIGAVSQPIERVTQETFPTTHLKKNELLLKHLSEIQGRVLIFTRTKRRTDNVFHLLERNKISVVSLHGGRTQGQRKVALEAFRSGESRIMVATDIAGRGIDVDDIECVINYDLPANREDYIHRIGRTARMGKSGSALNYTTQHDSGVDIIKEREPKRGQSHKPVGRTENRPGWKKEKGKRPFQRRTPADGYAARGDRPPRNFGPRRFEKDHRQPRPPMAMLGELRRDEKPDFQRFENASKPMGEAPSPDARPPRPQRPEHRHGDRREFRPFRGPGKPRMGGRRDNFRPHRPEQGEGKPFSEFRSKPGFQENHGRKRPPFAKHRNAGFRSQRPEGREQKPFADFRSKPGFQEGPDRRRRPFPPRHRAEGFRPQRPDSSEQKPFADFRSKPGFQEGPGRKRRPFPSRDRSEGQGERPHRKSNDHFTKYSDRKPRFGSRSGEGKPFEGRRPFPGRGDDRPSKPPFRFKRVRPGQAHDSRGKE